MSVHYFFKNLDQEKKERENHIWKRRKSGTGRDPTMSKVKRKEPVEERVPRVRKARGWNGARNSLKHLSDLFFGTLTRDLLNNILQSFQIFDPSK